MLFLAPTDAPTDASTAFFTETLVAAPPPETLVAAPPPEPFVPKTPSLFSRKLKTSALYLLIEALSIVLLTSVGILSSIPKN